MFFKNKTNRVDILQKVGGGTKESPSPRLKKKGDRPPSSYAHTSRINIIIYIYIVIYC